MPRRDARLFRGIGECRRITLLKSSFSPLFAPAMCGATGYTVRRLPIWLQPLIDFQRHGKHAREPGIPIGRRDRQREAGGARRCSRRRSSRRGARGGSSQGRRAAGELPAGEGRNRERPPPRAGRRLEGAQVRDRELCGAPAARAGQPGSGRQRYVRRHREGARRRRADAAPADERAREGPRRRAEPGWREVRSAPAQAISMVPADQEPNTVVTVLQRAT